MASGYIKELQSMPVTEQARWILSHSGGSTTPLAVALVAMAQATERRDWGATVVKAGEVLQRAQSETENESKAVATYLANAAKTFAEHQLTIEKPPFYAPLADLAVHHPFGFAGAVVGVAAVGFLLWKVCRK